MIQPCGLGKDLRERDRNDVRVATEADQREHLPAEPLFVDSGADCIDDTRDFVADNHRRAGSIRVQTAPREDVGEVDAGRPDPDT